MAPDEMFSVEETSTSPQETPTAVETPAAETPSTSMIPDRNQQEVLDIIRDSSAKAGGFELQNGRVVAKRAEPAAQGTPAATPAEPAKAAEPVKAEPEQSADPMVEITWQGQKVMKPLSEVKNLAQQGFDYTQKTQELARKNQELEAIMANLVVPQQPAQGTEAEGDDANIAKALEMVKERFGKDDPNFEYDPLDLKQQAHFARSLNRLDSQLASEAAATANAQRIQTERDNRLASWETTQRAADPEYNNVIGWAMENVGTPEKPTPRLKQILTAAEYEAADKAFREGDTATIAKVVNFAKKKYQVQKLGLSTKPTTVPPVVQSPGSGAPAVQTPAKRDATQLGSMTQEQRLAWIKGNLTRP